MADAKKPRLSQSQRERLMELLAEEVESENGEPQVEETIEVEETNDGQRVVYRGTPESFVQRFTLKQADQESPAASDDQEKPQDASGSEPEPEAPKDEPKPTARSRYFGR